MTIQIWTTQIPTIQILEKIVKRLYLNKLFELERNKKYICRHYYYLQATFFFFSKF